MSRSPPRLKRHGAVSGVNFDDYKSAMKNSGMNELEKMEIWNAYEKSTKKPSRGSKQPTKTPKRRRSPKNPIRRSNLMNKDLDPTGRQMSPSKLRPSNVARIESKVESVPKPVQLFLPREISGRVAYDLPLGTLFQVLRASPDLKNALDLKFWVEVYRREFGYTQEFEMATSTNTEDWMNLTEKRYDAIKRMHRHY